MSRAACLALAITLMAPHSLSACATCFGASDTDLARGMNMGILSLLAVVIFVLGGFAAFFISLARRAAAVGTGAKVPVTGGETSTDV